MPYLSLIKMSRHSLQDQTNIPLIVTTNEAGTARSSTGTSLDSCSLKAKSCRSFVRPQKLNNEHRNKSVPYNLQVELACPSFLMKPLTCVPLTLVKAIIIYLHNLVEMGMKRTVKGEWKIHGKLFSPTYRSTCVVSISFCLHKAVYINDSLFAQHVVESFSCQQIFI